MLQRLDGVPHLMAGLLCGARLRVLKRYRRHVQDIDFASNQIVGRAHLAGKGDKDRVTMLPGSAKSNLARHLDTVQAQHHSDLAVGAGWVELPTALLRKYPQAGREWVWQWIFPATRIYRDRLTGQPRRHPLHESVLQRAVKPRSAMPGSPSARALTPCATHSRRTCSRMATTFGPSRKSLGHRDVSTAMIYTHVLNRGPAAVRSPADRMFGR